MTEPYDPNKVHWFGSPWPSDQLRAPVCSDESYHIPTPVDTGCALCCNQISDGDAGVRMPHINKDGERSQAYVHIECELRALGITP